MNKKILNLSTYSLISGIIPWLYAIFAELLIPAITMIAAPLAYLSSFASIIMAIIAIRKKTEQDIRLAQIALASNILFILVVIFSLFFLHNHNTTGVNP
ncbi:MAG: hypothetical protein WCE45_09470 [Sedimentisphaerales bacterium]